jgi:cell division protein FtsB
MARWISFITMTFIQPNKKNILLRFCLVLIVVGLMGGTFWLITLYNQTVNLNHEISAAKAELDSIGAENTALNNQIVTALGDTDHLTAMASSDGLVIAKPQYVNAAQ